MNGVLKRMVHMFCKKNDTTEWVKVLPQIVKNINGVFNCTTKLLPQEVIDAYLNNDGEKLKGVKATSGVWHKR